jgi:hypothetical protein
VAYDAQHVAVKRALEGLQRQGRIIGFRTGRARVPGLGPGSDGRTELCHHWMTEKGLAKWIAMGWADSEIERVLAKAKAIGMKLESGAENKPANAMARGMAVDTTTAGGIPGD